jgi:uncharacterized glyoxalase superfamily protein PhnB
MLSDAPPGMGHTPGNTVTICISGENVDTLRGSWARLVEGGTVMVQLEKQMWGDEFAWAPTASASRSSTAAPTSTPPPAAGG